jgi:dihydroflavonol-4-reductase
LLYEVNVGGTKASMRAALDAGVEKVVYTSTNNAIAASGPTPTNEEALFNYWKSKDHYSMSKYVAENEVWKSIAHGLPAVIVNPTLVIGTHDIKPTPSGQMIIDVVNGKMPIYIDGGLNIVDVDDVSRGHILAAQKGRVGERYLLGGRNLTVYEYLKTIADIAGVKAPSIKLPYRLAVAVGYLYEFGAWLTKKPPVVTASEVRIGKMTEWYDCSKAVNELGLPQTPTEETITKALAWFEANGYLS